MLVSIVVLVTLQSHAFKSREAERDHICMLAAYTLVSIDWQSQDEQKYRGDNIGCVMLDEKTDKLISAGLDCSGYYKDNTEHAEKICIRTCQEHIKIKHAQFKEKVKREKQSKFEKEKESKPEKEKPYLTIYTTLEPEAQCAGMIIMQPMISKVVYGQENPMGKVIERLQFDSSLIWKSRGYASYPSNVASSQSQDQYAKELDKAYKDPSLVYKNIIDFLQGKIAKKIFEDANIELLQYVNRKIKIEFNQNTPFVDHVNRFIVDSYKSWNIRIEPTKNGYIKQK